MSGMIIHPRRKCEKCLGLGIWGASTVAKTRRCDTHKAEGDKNLVEGKCASCGFEVARDKAGLCLSCGEFPHIKRSYLVKQNAVGEVLKRKFAIGSYDRMLDGGVCSKKRPDFVIDGAHRKIVVEVDEFQHKRGKDYTPGCEELRMWDIAQALGMPTIFIRFNPDPYTGVEGRREDPSSASRIKALVAWIQTLQSREPPAGVYVSALYLYYDGFTRVEDAREIALADPLDQYKPTPPRGAPPMTDNELDQLLADFGY